MTDEEKRRLSLIEFHKLVKKSSRVERTFVSERLNPELLPYVDEKGYLKHLFCCFPFPVSPNQESSFNSICNENYNVNKKYYEQYLRDKDYDNLFLFIDRDFKLKWFIDHFEEIYRNVGDKKYYELLNYVLVEVDNHDPTREHYSKLISYGKNHLFMMTEDERKLYDELPEKFFIYRGTSSDKKITKENVKGLLGNSWSIDREISIWFSLKHSPKYRGSNHFILLTYEVNKSEIISYFTTRGEKEIFLDYTKINLSKLKFQLIPKNYKLKVSFDKPL